MKVKTSELIGPALDWAVAKCEGRDYHSYEYTYATDGSGKVWAAGTCQSEDRYSTDWSQGGPIIEREKIDIRWVESNWREIEGCWAGTYMTKIRYARTPLIAAMRCYVASKLGMEVDVPEELLK